MSSEKCRICFSVDFLQSIFRKLDSVLMSTRIKSLAKVQIQPDDGLPNKICLNCVNNLKNCLKFIKQCEESDFKLRSTYNLDGSAPITELELPDIYSNDSEPILSEGDKKNISEDDFVELEINLSNDDTNSSNNENQSEQTSHVNPKISRQEQCSTCGKVMSSRFRLKTHLRTHTGERPFSCSHCNRSFALAQNLKVHLRTHTGEKPLSCPDCDCTFAHSSGLLVHRRKHSGQTPYRCPLCPSSFRTAGHLQYHVRSHTGEKNFSCTTCARAFITRSDLAAHARTHTGEKPHVCCVCGRRVSRAAHLRRHMALHSRGSANASS